MNVRVLLLLLLVSVVLAFRPRFRRIGLVSSALLVALILWVNIREWQLPDEPEPMIAESSVNNSTATALPPRVDIIAVQLEGRGAPWHLTGSVRNVGEVPVKWLRLHIERYDCPAASTAIADCTLLWQGEHTVRVAIAAGATAKLDESFYSHGAVPQQKGELRDQIAINETG
jgi:hypothetical protein